MGVGNFVGGDDGRAHGAKGGKAFGERPLRGLALDVAGADVVDDGVAVDMALPLVGGDAVTAVADNEG